MNRFEPVIDEDNCLQYIIDHEAMDNVDPADFFDLVNEIAYDRNRLLMCVNNSWSKWHFIKQFSDDTNPNEAVDYVLTELNRDMKNIPQDTRPEFEKNIMSEPLYSRRKLEAENARLKEKLFEAEKDYLIETADVSDKLHLEEDIKELKQEIFGDDYE